MPLGDEVPIVPLQENVGGRAHNSANTDGIEDQAGLANGKATLSAEDDRDLSEGESAWAALGRVISAHGIEERVQETYIDS